LAHNIRLKKILAHKLVTPMSSYVDPLELTRLAGAASAIVLKRVEQKLYERNIATSASEKKRARVKKARVKKSERE